MYPTTCPGFLKSIYSSIHPCMYPSLHSICTECLLCVRYLYKVLWVQKLTYYMAEDDLWRKMKQVKGQRIMKKEVLLHRGWCRTVSLIRWHIKRWNECQSYWNLGKHSRQREALAGSEGEACLARGLEGPGSHNGQGGLSWLNEIT